MNQVKKKLQNNRIIHVQGEDLETAEILCGDILNYQYKIFADARDWSLVWKSLKIALKDGWNLRQTWRAIIFPLLGEKIVNFGVKIKSVFK